MDWIVQMLQVYQDSFTPNIPAHTHTSGTCTHTHLIHLKVCSELQQFQQPNYPDAKLLQMLQLLHMIQRMCKILLLHSEIAGTLNTLSLSSQLTENLFVSTN